MSIIFRAASFGKVFSCSVKVSVENNKFKSLSVFDTKLFCCKLPTATTLSSRGYASQTQEKEEKIQVYSGALRKSVRNIKIFSLLTSAFGLGLQPYVYWNAVTTGATNYVLPMFGLVGTFAIITPTFLHFIMKKYVIQIDYLPKTSEYIATFYSFFATKKHIRFTPYDVSIPTVLGMFSNCNIKGKGAFLDVTHFTDKSHFIKIMNYDKPVDLEIETEQEPIKSIERTTDEYAEIAESIKKRRMRN